jgi:outer membrane receptor protein involved in Fe transport
MNAEHKLALTPIAAAVAAVLAPGTAAQAQQPEGQQGAKRGGALEEITVTARKRTESAQDIPIAIQALSQAALQTMGAKAMEDYARFTPSVNVVTYSPTSSVIVFRGAITGPGYIAQSTSSVYLDEVSITTTGSQPSVRVVDIERVEALSGPQGTLYGSDAQAGTMRIVTNKPDPTGYEAVFDGELRGGSDSDGSYRGSLVFNVPLIDDKLALRLVGYNDRDGGYIDNVAGNTPDQSAFLGPDFYPAGFGTLDNSASVEEGWNDAEITGARASLLWHMNDDWSATLGYAWQDTEIGADNYYDPFVGDLQTVRFHDEWATDEFSVVSLTLDADLGFAQLVSATSYYERKNSYLYDVTAYAHYWAATYCKDANYTKDYMLANPAYFPYANYYFANPDNGYVVFWPVYCQGPSVDSDFFSGSLLHAQQDKITQEFRLSAQGETLDWLVGLYYESSNDDWQSSFAQPTLGGDGTQNIYQDSISAQYYEFITGAPVDPLARSHWYSESRTDWETKAIFGEMTWHFSDSIDITAGGRYYERSNTNNYFVNHPGGFGLPAYVPTPDRKNVDEEFIPKLSVNYMFDSDGDGRMLYGLYTRGKRPGGINRLRGDPFFAGTYVSDLMDNYELGYKSNFAGGQGRFNVTGYFMDWSDYQLELVDPSSVQCEVGGVPDPSIQIPQVCGQPWQQVVTNAGAAHITGVNVEVDYSPNENWVLGFNAEWMEAETDTSADLTGDGIDDLTSGMQLPLVPDVKAAAWIEYHWPVNWFGPNNAYIRTQWSYQGDSVNILERLPADSDPNPQLTNEAYAIGDLRFGLQGDSWEAAIFVNNLADERAQYTWNTGQFEWGAAQVAEGREHFARVYTNRPREVGVSFRKRWGD